MAEQLKAKVIITAEGDKAVKAAKKVSKELKDTGKAGKQAGNEVDAGAAKGASGLKNLGSAGKKAGADVAAAGSKGSAGLKKLDNAAGSAGGGMTTLSVAVLGLGQSITGITDAIFGFNEKIVALERSTFGLKQMTMELSRQEEDLAEILRSGELTAREQKRAIEDLAFSYEELGIEQRTVKAEQEALNGEYVTFAVNTAATVAQSIIAITALTATDTAGKFANALASSAMGTALLGAAAATKALTISMLTSPLAPYAIAAIAAGAAFIAYNDNILGLRDGIEDLTGVERGSLPTLGFSLTGVEKSTDEATESVEDFMKRAEDFAKQNGTQTIPAFEGLGTAAGGAANEIKALTRATEELKKKRVFDTVLETAARSVSEAQTKLHDAVEEKGLIDEGMMIALQQAEASGMIAKGTAGRYRTTIGQNAGSIVRAINKANFSMIRNKNFSFINNSTNKHRVSSSGRSILSAAQAAGYSTGSAGGGRRNRTRSQLAKLHSGFSSESFNFAEGLGLISRFSAKNRRSGFRIISEGQTKGQEAMALFARTGITPPQIKQARSRSTVWSVAANPSAAQAALNAARSEMAAFNSLISFNPNLSGMNLAASGVDTDFLVDKLSSEKSRISNIQTTLGMDKSNILSLESTQQGIVQVNGMMDFKDRMGLISGGVV